MFKLRSTQVDVTRRMRTMSACKQTARLLACVLIICYCHRGTQCLHPAAAATATATGDSQASVGISFPQDDKAFLVASSGRQLENPEEQYTKTPDGDEHWQSKRLRFEYPPNPLGKDLDAKELMRRYHIEQLLEALTGTIPPSPKKLRSSQRSALGEPAPVTTVAGKLAAGQQIFRSGRTYSGADIANDAGKQRWQSNSLEGSALDGRTGPRVEAGGQTGIVWSASEPSVGPYGGKWPRPMAKQTRSRIIDDQVNQKVLSELVVGDYRPHQLNRLYQDQTSLGMRKSHRSGTEEIPIQTPVHSTHSGGDYETKRVENTRGWNNLRGMWGKRSTDAADNNRRLFEASLGADDGDRGAAAAAGFEAAQRANDDGGSDDYNEAADKAHQALTSALQSIRAM